MSATESCLTVAGETLLKLRENTGFTEQQVAKKLSITVEELAEIEKGGKPVDVHLLKRISEVYQYPLVTLFEEKAPEFPHKIKDYRINRNKSINPEVRKAERRAYYLVNAIQEITEEKSKIPDFADNLTAMQLAEKFTEKITLDRPKAKKAEDALEGYKEQIENKMNVLVIEAPLKNNDVRAFSINSDISIVVLNESDKPEIKLFSLFHEMCHILKRSSAMCSIELNGDGKDENEQFCDKFASEVLVPTPELKMIVARVGTSQKSIADLTTQFYVSKQVMMLKLLHNNLIDQGRYAQFKKAFDEELVKKGKFGKRNWEKTYLKRVGKKTVETVKSAHRRGKISTADALDILNVKGKYAEKFLGEGGYDGSK